MRNKKRNRIMLLLILLLGITVGFAALATTLKINGNASITKNTWSVYWDEDSIEITQESKGDTIPIVENGEDGSVNTKVTWNVNLELPGDYYEFTIDAVNAGTLDAMITGITPTLPQDLPSYVSYSVTYADGGDPEQYHLLPKGTKSGSTITPTTQKYKVRIEFKDTITPEQMDAIPEEGLSLDFGYEVTYGQADDNAISLTCPGSACVYAFPYFPGTTTTYDEETDITTYTYDENQWWISDGVHAVAEEGNKLLETGTHQRSTLQSSDYKTNYEDVIQESGKNYFIGMILNKNNQINKTFMCYKKNDEVTCIETKAPLYLTNMDWSKESIQLFDDPLTKLSIYHHGSTTGRIVITQIKDANKKCYIERGYINKQNTSEIIGCVNSD